MIEEHEVKASPNSSHRLDEQCVCAIAVRRTTSVGYSMEERLERDDGGWQMAPCDHVVLPQRARSGAVRRHGARKLLRDHK